MQPVHQDTTQTHFPPPLVLYVLPHCFHALRPSTNCASAASDHSMAHMAHLQSSSFVQCLTPSRERFLQCCRPALLLIKFLFGHQLFLCLFLSLLLKFCMFVSHLFFFGLLSIFFRFLSSFNFSLLRCCKFLGQHDARTAEHQTHLVTRLAVGFHCFCLFLWGTWDEVFLFFKTVLRDLAMFSSNLGKCVPLNLKVCQLIF
mmetsp:Transcript_27420/g.53900  ORF Transcript_27420/g.53900 Transcript_27420/m.53900 type:complete len:201 (-) Transcript_27420:1027-1629(-)